MNLLVLSQEIGLYITAAKKGRLDDYLAQWPKSRSLRFVDSSVIAHEISKNPQQAA